MYPVDLENNERSCEYSSIVRGGFREAPKKKFAKHLFVYKQERSNHMFSVQMNQTTKRIAPSGRAVLTRATRKDKHRKYRPISEMRNALKLNQ